MKTLKQKAKEEVMVLGLPIPYWQDCEECGDKLACHFSGFAYDQPCIKCKSTEKYEQEQKSYEKPMSMSEAFKNQEIAGVFQGMGTTFYTNHKGNVIKTEPIRPLKTGDPHWKRPS
jgi:hypothetical protein